MDTPSSGEFQDVTKFSFSVAHQCGEYSAKTFGSRCKKKVLNSGIERCAAYDWMSTKVRIRDVQR
jgi:hypothetical protein